MSKGMDVAREHVEKGDIVTDRVILYHGGAPGFKPGDVILPHPTKHTDGCEWCSSGADDSHLPDRVFATPVRLYAKFYASKWGLGWLYMVAAAPEMERSDKDSIETYHASGFVVTRVCERAVELTMSERRHLFRLWTIADKERGFEVTALADYQIRQMLGMRR